MHRHYDKVRGQRSRLIKVATSVLVVVALCAFQTLVQPVSLDRVSRGLESIQSKRIRATLSFLASTHFKGRGTGTPEAELTAAYIASVLEKGGLEPADRQKNSFLQSFELSQALPKEPSFLEVVSKGRSPTAFTIGTDFVPSPWGADSAGVEGEAVFAGYGISAPEYNYDDYLGLSVKGKVVVLLSQSPGDEKTSPFKKFSKIDYEDLVQKSTGAEKLGAVAVIVILPSSEELSSMGSTFSKAKTYLANDIAAIRIPSMIVTQKVGAALVASASEPSEQGLIEVKKRIDENLKPRSFALGKTVRIQTSYQRRALIGQNVIGVITGSDKVLKEEFIILGAHHDHLGVGENNEIFFGADDNASGTTGLLELAEAFGQNQLKPKRSLMFAAWGAEELGLLGSKHYAQNPLVPLRKTIGMIQMDMIGRNEERDVESGASTEQEGSQRGINSLNVMGSPFSEDLKFLLEKSNQRIGLELKFRFDFGTENLNKRSDHWSFLRAGIPSFLLFSGFHADYHKITDTVDKINFSKMERILKLVYLTVWELSETTLPPRFNNELFRTQAATATHSRQSKSQILEPTH